MTKTSDENAMCCVCGKEVKAPNATHTYWKLPFHGDGRMGAVEGEIWVCLRNPTPGHLCGKCAMQLLTGAVKDLEQWEDVE